MPPPNGSIGSITDGSTSTAETFRQQNWRTPTTVKPSPAIRSGAQKQSDRTRRGDSYCVSMSNGEVHGRVVAVTGASGGVGRAVVREFAKRGDSIALLSRGEVGLAATGGEVTVAGATPMVVPV